MISTERSISSIFNVLDPQVLKYFFKDYYIFFAIAIFLGACLFTYYLIPKVVWVVKKKKLVKPVIKRSAHSFETPTLGGAAFFMTLVLSICTLQGLHLVEIENYLIGSITILFMVGIKDDLVVSSCRVKLLGQLAAAALIVFAPQMHITSLYGFLGIYEIPHLLGYVISAFLMVALINAYNLIDGIDGLAGIIGIIICSCYAYVFYLTGEPYFVFLSIVVAGILLAFLRFNFSSGKYKIFMGDSGSLVIGLVLGFLTLKVLTLPQGQLLAPGVQDFLSNRYVFILAVLFLPIFDTARVMVIRLLKRESPFKADRNHFHHILLDYGLKHYQASIFLGVINLSMFFLFVMLNPMLSNTTLLLTMVGVYLLIFTLVQMFTKYRDEYIREKAKNTAKRLSPQYKYKYINLDHNTTQKVG